MIKDEERSISVARDKTKLMQFIAQPSIPSVWGCFLRPYKNTLKFTNILWMARIETRRLLHVPILITMKKSIANMSLTKAPLNCKGKHKAKSDMFNQSVKVVNTVLLSEST
jgi:hypothetical protein